jgi:hypothetical protein
LRFFGGWKKTLISEVSVTERRSERDISLQLAVLCAKGKQVVKPFYSRITSTKLFYGVCSLNADVSKQSVWSIFMGELVWSVTAVGNVGYLKGNVYFKWSHPRYVCVNYDKGDQSNTTLLKTLYLLYNLFWQHVSTLSRGHHQAVEVFTNS